MTSEFENIEEEEVITEYEKAQNYVNEIMYQDVYNSIKYDEWSAREYGEDKVDTFDTAMSLYEKGYRREVDTIEHILHKFDNCNCTDRFFEALTELEKELEKLKGGNTSGT